MSNQSTKQELIDSIIPIEWAMFSSVQNVGGTASCQTQPDTFRVMRSSQLKTWTEAILESYLEDISVAQNVGRNLMTEKYARMMESTFPDEYARIRDGLPPLSERSTTIVNQIVSINLEWKDVVNARFPNLARQGRPVRVSDETGGYPSVETYMRSELLTYSEKTLALILEWTIHRKETGINGAEEDLLCQIHQLGYESLEAAEQAASKQSRFCGC